ncbi:hypothetical protein K466DRAFT_495211 [Polyporus arcularius HHB13444]|uniref:Fe2OG dioxygenase domain-containing protein n=1 Tax=Polyporus arcularius HHB13444 TaxID=1314778 RepID=A0A5C3P7F7_9APHY|nr:hypothetical protein K466DRAFT_495211 [Polyporus arcularius HHB13444]
MISPHLRTTHPLVDSEGRMLGLLVGEMRDPDYAYLVANATHHLREARKYCHKPGTERHRRGSFSTVTDGISIGGGQPHPMNKAHPIGRERRAVRRLRNASCIRRIANFASSALRTYVPEIYNEYARTLDEVCEEDPSLRRPFTNNVFAGVTFNLGPRVVTRRHRDHLNLPFGWCSITVLGDFDYERGGHLVLWDLGLVIEIPPGATFLIPSAILEHSNLDIAEGETRMSLTQYSAGGLFRWVRCGSRTQRAFEQAGHTLETGETRWAAGIALLGKWGSCLGRKSG